MYKKILVPALNGHCEPRALKLAGDVARLFDSHIDCLYVHPDAAELARDIAPMGPEGAVYSGQLVETILEADKKSCARAHKVYDAFCAVERLDHNGPVTAAWCETEGNGAKVAIRQAFYRDLVVLGRPTASNDLTSTDAIEVVIGCGRPVMVAPGAPLPASLGTVVIAWKESVPAARAVAAAMPMLAKASKIHVIGIAEDKDAMEPALKSAERLAGYLRGHGLSPQAGRIAADDRDPAEVLLDVACTKLHGELLVMGAYGHSRAREFVFGGVTRRVLHGAPLPVLLAH